MNTYDYSLSKDLIKSGKCALLVVDMQNDYMHPDGDFSKKGIDCTLTREVAPNVVGLIDTMRKADMPIIFIQTTHQDETDSDVWKSHTRGRINLCCRANTWGADFYAVKPLPNDIIVNKYRYSSFHGTRLNTVLHTLDVKCVIIAGIVTNLCVESTARDAYVNDYYVIVVDDCCAAETVVRHKAALQNIDECFGMVATSGDLEEIVNS